VAQTHLELAKAVKLKELLEAKIKAVSQTHRISTPTVQQESNSDMGETIDGAKRADATDNGGGPLPMPPTRAAKRRRDDDEWYWMRAHRNRNRNEDHQPHLYCTILFPHQSGGNAW
jgi:hypothetical protein